MNRIYLDYAATTPLDARVRAQMERCQKLCGNPNSIHHEGQRVRAEIDTARRALAGVFGRDEQQVIFTASATTANNLVIHGVVERFKKLYPHLLPEIIISPLEHASVYEPARALERAGIIRLHLLPIHTDGTIEIEELKELLSEKTALVSVQWVNNETGIIHNVSEIIKAVSAFRTRTQSIYPYLHTDAVQGIGHVPSKEIEGADFISLSAHKVYGPTGVGVLCMPTHVLMEPIIYGGGQEYGWWSGTESVDRIVGCAHALMYALEEQKDAYTRLETLREYFIRRIQKYVPKIRICTSAWKHTSPHILSIHVCGIKRPDIALDMQGIAVSSGAACSVGSVVPSRTLQALGILDADAREMVRISMGKQTTQKEIDACVEVLQKIVL